MTFSRSFSEIPLPAATTLSFTITVGVSKTPYFWPSGEIASNFLTSTSPPGNFLAVFIALLAASSQEGQVGVEVNTFTVTMRTSNSLSIQ